MKRRPVNVVGMPFPYANLSLTYSTISLKRRMAS